MMTRLWLCWGRPASHQVSVRRPPSSASAASITAPAAPTLAAMVSGRWWRPAARHRGRHWSARPSARSTHSPRRWLQCGHRLLSGLLNRRTRTSSRSAGLPPPHLQAPVRVGVIPAIPTQWWPTAAVLRGAAQARQSMRPLSPEQLTGRCLRGAHNPRNLLWPLLLARCLLLAVTTPMRRPLRGMRRYPRRRAITPMQPNKPSAAAQPHHRWRRRHIHLLWQWHCSGFRRCQRLRLVLPLLR